MTASYTAYKLNVTYTLVIYAFCSTVRRLPVLFYVFFVNSSTFEVSTHMVCVCVCDTTRSSSIADTTFHEIGGISRVYLSCSMQKQ